MKCKGQSRLHLRPLQAKFQGTRTSKTSIMERSFGPKQAQAGARVALSGRKIAAAG